MNECVDIVVHSGAKPPTYGVGGELFGFQDTFMVVVVTPFAVCLHLRTNLCPDKTVQSRGWGKLTAMFDERGDPIEKHGNTLDEQCRCLER